MSHTHEDIMKECVVCGKTHPVKKRFVDFAVWHETQCKLKPLGDCFITSALKSTPVCSEPEQCRNGDAYAFVKGREVWDSCSAALEVACLPKE